MRKREPMAFHMLKWDHQPGPAQPLLVGLDQLKAADERFRIRREVLYE